MLRKENIPVKTEENIRAGIQKLYKEYQNLGKEKSSNTDKASVKRQICQGELVDCFDIFRQIVMDTISVYHKNIKNFVGHKKKIAWVRQWVQ